MDLSDGWVIYLLLGLTAYVILDGYDLGIGVLTLVQRDGEYRRAMYELVARTWDGNESWILMVALAAWGGFPLALGVALPSLYIPLGLMLWSLICRGVSIEMLAQYPGWHRGWGRVFGYASLLAGFCQGAAFGGLVAGVAVNLSQDTFAGGPWSFLHDGYAVLTGLTAVALYAFAGAAWVYLKSDGALQHFAARAGRVAVPALAGGTVLCWALLQTAGTTTLHPGAPWRLPVWLTGAVVLAAGLAVAYWSFGRASSFTPVYAALAVYAGGLTSLLGLLYPELVPPDITVHAAASPSASLVFMMIGVGLCIPVIFTYQTFAHWVFRGKLSTGKEVAGK